MTGETPDDLEKTKKIISETMPHDVMVSPVAYYPGTKIYSDSIDKKMISDNIWFDTVENGLYLNEKKANDRNIKNLLSYSSRNSKKAKYTKSDFKIHEQTTGSNCWMNYIIQGDFYSDESDMEKSSYFYNKLMNDHPANIWGYLRMAELICDKSPIQALRLFKKASDIAPAYYGIWYRIAQINLNIGNIREAQNSIEKALKLNPYEPDITDLFSVIKNNKKKMP